MADGIDRVEETLLNALTERLEQALELASDASVLNRLADICSLAAEAATLAHVGRMLLRTGVE